MKKRQNKSISFTRKNEIIICMIVLVLSVLGTILTQSAKLSSGTIWISTIGEHLFWFCIGMVLLVLCSFINLQSLRRITPVIGIVAIVLLFLLGTPLGITINGATRWLDLGIITIRAAAAVLFAHILVIACMTAYFHENGNKYQLLGWTWGVATITAGCVSWMTNSSSSTVIILGITFLITMVFAEMLSFHVSFLVLGALSFIMFVFNVMKGTGEDSFRLTRLKAWINPYDYADDVGYQAVNQLEAVKTGGWFGKGFGNGELPKAYRGAYYDSLFSMVCEEFGWIAAAVLVVVIFVLLYQIYKVLRLAIKSEDSFSAVLVMGVLAHIGLCAMIYVAGNMNLLPNISGTLPFVTYSGASEMFLFCEIGLVLAVGKRCECLIEKK